MAYNFNNNSLPTAQRRPEPVGYQHDGRDSCGDGGAGAARRRAGHVGRAAVGGVGPLPVVPLAAAERRGQPAEFCTHREVKPYAGTTGFDPDAWCPECQYYKLRRAPKKRSPSDDYSY